MTVSSNLIINNSNPFEGEVSIPGDKSITHRAIMISSLCNGKINISNALVSDDCKHTINVFRELGVNIEIKDDMVSVTGKGLTSLKKPNKKLYAGNSGTLMRIIAGILATQDFTSSISGDKSLNTRPMKRIEDPLKMFGANIISKNSMPPLSFKPSKSLKPISYVSNLPSAQVKSCLIFAALFIDGTSVITEKTKTRDHTERLLEYLEYPISIEDNAINIFGKKSFKCKDIVVPSDISSAAFFIVAALIRKDSKLVLKNIGINKLRIGLIEILIEMGANIRVFNKSVICNESVADIEVQYSELKPINISGEKISRLIDELPILFIACAVCKGISEFHDIGELRFKESDRIKSMEEGLNVLGIKTLSTTDSLKIFGGSFNGGIVNSNHDHRVAMSFIVAGAISKKPITVLNTENIPTSFPNFKTTINGIGAEVYEV